MTYTVNYQLPSELGKKSKCFRFPYFIITVDNRHWELVGNRFLLFSPYPWDATKMPGAATLVETLFTPIQTTWQDFSQTIYPTINVDEQSSFTTMNNHWKWNGIIWKLFPSDGFEEGLWIRVKGTRIWILAHWNKKPYLDLTLIKNPGTHSTLIVSDPGYNLTGYFFLS